MIKQTSNRTESIFEDLSQKILGSQQQIQDKLIHDLFADFTSQPSKPNIKNIEEQTHQQKPPTQEPLEIIPKNQTIPTILQPQMKILKALKDEGVCLHLRHLVSNSLKQTCKKIQEHPNNFSHHEVQSLARNLLLKYFCHYCKIFEQMKLQSEARRLEEDVSKLFIKNSVEICCTLFHKGFRMMVILFKIVLKVMSAGSFFSQSTQLSIKTKIKRLIGVRVDQLLWNHKILAYESVFLVKGSDVPDRLEQMIKSHEDQIQAKKREKRQMEKQQKNKLKSVLRRSNLKLQHQGAPSKRVKLQEFSSKDSKMDKTLGGTSKIQNSKLQQSSVKLEKIIRTQQKPPKTAYKVVETIILDQEQEQSETQTSPLFTHTVKYAQKRQKIQQPGKSQTPISKIGQAKDVQIEQHLNLINLSKKLSSSFIEEVKKKLRDNKKKVSQ